MNRIQRLSLVGLLVLAACEPDDGGPGQLVQIPGPDALTGVDLCKGVADRCADEGARECTADGPRECVEVSGCLAWGFPQACAPGTQCVGGACVAGCAGQACTAIGATKCDPGALDVVVRCDDYDGDGCLEWGGAAACEAPGVCALGACAAQCVDECEVGAAKCEGSAVVACAAAGGGGCARWGAPAACASGACALGQCVTSCVDACASEGLAACDGAGVVRCERGGDGCLAWGTASACPEGTSCSSGQCAAACADECEAGAVDCAAGGVRTCGEHDLDPCRDWGLPEACPAGTTCSDGACAASCISECTTLGARGCGWDGVRVRECGQWDGDACLEWADVAVCEGGAVCSLGACSATCADECEAGARRCRPGSTTRVEVCGDADADPCLEWGDAEDCAAGGKVCDAGECQLSCTDDCQGATCAAGLVVPCGQLDADACQDAGTPVACAAWERCEAGACAAAPVLEGLVLSEVLYNAEGYDYDVFLEVHGPPGADLAGYSLVGVNGFGGGDYMELPLTGTLDSAGFYVVAHPWAAPYIADVADLLDFYADLQNGPDSLQLRFGPTVVDALGYGAFGTADVFAGEGEAALGVLAGHSLSRDGAFTDTQDNLADFHEQELPSPAAPPVTALPPGAWGDVLVTEVMPDPKALSDEQGEWFELHNPGAIARVLTGCTIGDGASEAHTLGTLEVPAGGWITLARGATPGFAPTYVWTGVKLNNDGDALELECGGVAIDGTSWDQAPQGRSLQRDLTADTWCEGTSAYHGNDKGSPGVANPPCATSGTYDQTLADSAGGICNTTSNWNDLTYTATLPAVADGTLSFEWFVAWCATFGTPGQVWVELKTGETWTSVGGATATGLDKACKWLFQTGPIPQATLNAARTASGAMLARFRVQSGCAFGILCGNTTQVVPTNCGRRFRLKYDH